DLSAGLRSSGLAAHVCVVGARRVADEHRAARGPGVHPEVGHVWPPSLSAWSMVCTSPTGGPDPGDALLPARLPARRHRGLGPRLHPGGGGGPGGGRPAPLLARLESGGGEPELACLPSHGDCGRDPGLRGGPGRLAEEPFGLTHHPLGEGAGRKERGSVSRSERDGLLVWITVFMLALVAVLAVGLAASLSGQLD